jgi:hypothetical protein
MVQGTEQTYIIRSSAFRTITPEGIRAQVKKLSNNLLFIDVILLSGDEVEGKGASVEEIRVRLFPDMAQGLASFLINGLTELSRAEESLLRNFGVTRETIQKIKDQ